MMRSIMCGGKRILPYRDEATRRKRQLCREYRTLLPGNSLFWFWKACSWTQLDLSDKAADRLLADIKALTEVAD